MNFQGDSLRTGPPSFPHLNGHLNGPSINMIDVDNKKSAVDVSNELSRRVMELGKERSVEPESSMGHLQVIFISFKKMQLLHLVKISPEPKMRIRVG